MEIYNINKLPNYFPKDFQQTNVSISKKWTVRGLHITDFSKFVTCVKGEVFDVVVDVRKDSPTFMQCFNALISEKNSEQVLVPPYCAHGFMALSEENIVVYSQTSTYNPNMEKSLNWKDPTIGVLWPINPLKKYIISQKDMNAPFFKNIFTD